MTQLLSDYFRVTKLFWAKNIVYSRISFTTINRRAGDIAHRMIRRKQKRDKESMTVPAAFA